MSQQNRIHWQCVYALSLPQQCTGVGQPVNEFFTFLGEGKVPWDTYAQLLYRQEYCSSHSNAVTYHLYMHACEWNLSVSLCIDIYGLCVHEQLKGESGCNCKKYVRRCDKLLGAPKMISNCPPTSTTAHGSITYSMHRISMFNASNMYDMYLSEL